MQAKELNLISEEEVLALKTQESKEMETTLSTLTGSTSLPSIVQPMESIKLLSNTM